MDNEQIIINCYGLLQAYNFCEKQKDKQEIDVQPLLAIDFENIQPSFAQIKEEMQKLSKMTQVEQRQQQSVHLITKEIEQIFKVGQRSKWFGLPISQQQAPTYYTYVKYPMCYTWIKTRLSVNTKYQQTLQENFFQDDNILLKLSAKNSKIYQQYISDMLQENKNQSHYKNLAEKISQAGVPPYESYEEVFADCLMVGLNCMFYNFQVKEWVTAGINLIKDVFYHEQQLSQQSLPEWCNNLTNLEDAIQMVKNINKQIDQQNIL